MTQHILHYYQDEKNGSIIAVVAGIIVLLMAALLWKYFAEIPVAKGLSVGFFVTGVLVLAIGVSGIFYNNQKIKGLSKLHGQSEITLRQTEVTRMDKVMNQTFKYAFITFGIMMLATLAFTLFTTSWYWKGFGMALSFFVALAMLSDTFSMHRNGKYLETIKNLNVTR